MTEPIDPEVERWLARWEADGTLPDPSDPRFRALRRTLLAFDLAKSAPGKELVEQVLDALAQETESAREVERRTPVRPDSWKQHGRRMWQEIRAQFRVDLSTPSLAYRSGASSVPSIYETPDFLVSLTRSPHEGIRGSIVPKSNPELPAGGAVSLLAEGRRERGELEPGGVFRFPRVPTGELEIEIEIGDQRISVGPILDRPV